MQMRHPLLLGVLAVGIAVGIARGEDSPARAAPAGWQPASPLSEARSHAPAVRLPDGSVLVAGGLGLLAGDP